MTTDVDQGYFQWSQEELTQRDASTGVTISQMLDHGSVSFGKFEFESLSWEKWSVFRHDRRQEELEKFNGLVAEKKAYFEEYYRRMRALKALQQQQQQQVEQVQLQRQQTELTLDYSVDGSASEEEREVEIRRRIEAEDGLGIGTVVVEPRKDPEESTVFENNMIVGGEKSGRLVAKKPVDGKVISKEPSGSTRPRPGTKPTSKPQKRPVIQKPHPQPQPPPPPPPRRIVRKGDNTSTSSLRVRTPKEASRTPKEPSRIIPVSSSSITKRPNSSSSMHNSNTKRPNSSSSMHSNTNTKRPSSSASMRSNSNTSGTKENAVTSASISTKRPTSSASTRIRPGSASGIRSSSAPRRPVSSAGDRGKSVRMEAIAARGKMSTSIHSTPRMNIIPSTVKSITIESKRLVSKEPLVINNSSTAVRRTERCTLDTQKSRSINLPPKKNSCTSGASENFSRNKNKEEPAKAATQPRTPARNNTTPARSSTPVRNAAVLHNSESNKIGTPRKPISSRTSETPRIGGRNHASSPSVSTRKPKAETKSWR